MHITDIKEVVISPLNIDAWTVRPFHTPPQWIVACLNGDPAGSFTVLSANILDVVNAAPDRLWRADFGDGRHTYWAKMAYATSYEALCAALGLLNVEVTS